MKKYKILASFLTLSSWTFVSAAENTPKSKKDLPKKILMRIDKKGKADAFVIPEGVDVTSEEQAKTLANNGSSFGVEKEEVPSELDQTTSKSGWMWTTSYAYASAGSGYAYASSGVSSGYYYPSHLTYYWSPS